MEGVGGGLPQNGSGSLLTSGPKNVSPLYTLPTYASQVHVSPNLNTIAASSLLQVGNLQDHGITSAVTLDSP